MQIYVALQKRWYIARFFSGGWGMGEWGECEGTCMANLICVGSCMVTHKSEKTGKGTIIRNRVCMVKLDDNKEQFGVRYEHTITKL